MPTTEGLLPRNLQMRRRVFDYGRN